MLNMVMNGVIVGSQTWQLDISFHGLFDGNKHLSIGGFFIATLITGVSTMWLFPNLSISHLRIIKKCLVTTYNH